MFGHLSVPVTYKAPLWVKNSNIIMLEKSINRFCFFYRTCWSWGRSCSRGHRSCHHPGGRGHYRSSKRTGRHWFHFWSSWNRGRVCCTERGGYWGRTTGRWCHCSPSFGTFVLFIQNVLIFFTSYNFKYIWFKNMKIYYLILLLLKILNWIFHYDKSQSLKVSIISFTSLSMDLAAWSVKH